MSVFAPTHRYEMALEIGEEAVRQGKWQQALTSFQIALVGLPREPRVYNGLGDTHLALSDTNRALASFKEAARLAVDNAFYTEKVAMLQRDMDLPAQAAQSYLLTGDILWRQGLYDAAETRWEQALELQGDMITIRERLALACRRRGDTASALHHYLALADILRREGRCLMALHVCYTALALTADERALWAATERAWRCVAAREGSKERSDSYPESGELLNAAAEFAQWQLAADIRQSTLHRTAGGNPEWFIHLRQAMLNEGYGNTGVAITFYEKAIAAGLDAPAAFFALGMLCRLAGRGTDARAALGLAARHPFYNRAVALIDS
jgi:tetratricopeptide (TPR) repeat protein